VLYDPSYGLTYSGATVALADDDFWARGVDGCYQMLVDNEVNEVDVGVDLDNDGTVDAVRVPVNTLVIRW